MIKIEIGWKENIPKLKMAKIETTANIVQVYVLLNENYVEDDDNMFRFDYR